MLNPAQPRSLVAASNCAAAGPTTLHLLDADGSAAGQALSRGKPLQAGLPDGTAGQLAGAWADVALMLRDAPGVRHVMVLPISSGGGGGSSSSGSGGTGAGSSSGGSSGSGSGSSQTCQLHGKAVQGALLLGFAAAPQLEGQRKAALARLAACLPPALARHAHDTLAFVNFAAGIAPSCCCCCCNEGDVEDAAAKGCRPLDGAGPGGSSPTRRALLSPAASHDSAGDSGADSDSSCGSFRRRHGFSKALVALAAADGCGGDGGPLAQHPLTLRFGSALAEREYRRWVLPLYRRADRISSLLMLAAMVVVALAEVRGA